jgi:predicted methyltransferase
LSQSAAAKPKVFSTCRGTARPKNPAASAAAKITMAIIFFIRSFRKALKLKFNPNYSAKWELRKPLPFSTLAKFSPLITLPPASFH